MSNDATPIKLTKTGRVVIEANGLVIAEGFGGDNCSCRDVAILACMWAMSVLQTEVTKTIESPGGGRIAID
jgi:hypothetical protein